MTKKPRLPSMGRNIQEKVRAELPETDFMVAVAHEGPGVFTVSVESRRTHDELSAAIDIPGRVASVGSLGERTAIGEHEIIGGLGRACYILGVECMHLLPTADIPDHLMEKAGYAIAPEQTEAGPTAYVRKA